LWRQNQNLQVDAQRRTVHSQARFCLLFLAEHEALSGSSFVDTHPTIKWWFIDIKQGFWPFHHLPHTASTPTVRTEESPVFLYSAIPIVVTS
jgi:hypothetical protein